MTNIFYTNGRRAAFVSVGLDKLASDPEMGDAMYLPLASATGDEGASHGRSHDNPQDNARTSFREHDRHVLRDPHNEAHPFPVGAQQSRNEKRAVSLEDLMASSDTPVVKVDPSVGTGLSGGAFYNNQGKGTPYVGYTDEISVPGLAHELGHADVDRSSLGRAAQHPLARLAWMAAPLAGPALATLAPRKLRIPAAMLASTLLSAPTLYSEGAATLSGYNRLKRLGASDKELNAYLADMAGPSASYLASATAVPAGLAAVYNAIKSGGHKLSRRTTFRGLDISIENDTGERREWYDPHADRHGSTVMKYPYGYIRGTEGMDGDHIDCYLGPDEDASNVYVITTNKAPDFTKEDEQKCMLGFKSAKAAKDAFLAHFDNPKFFRKMKAMRFEDFKAQALRTKDSSDKKIASNLYQSDYDRPRGTGPGSTHNQTPGDFLGLPQGKVTGQTQIVGSNAETPSDRIERLFKYNDIDTDSRVMEGADGTLPSGPTT